MEEMRDINRERFGTDSVKKEENISLYYDVIDVEDEFGVIQNTEFIRNQVSYVDDKMYLSGDRVNIKLSKRGSVYFLVKDKLIRGLVRNILLEKLVEYKYSMNSEPVVELPSYWVYEAIGKTGKKLLIWISKKNNLYSMVYNYDNGLKLLEEQKVKINYNRLKEENRNDTRGVGSSVYIPEQNEIYGSLEPELFTIRTDELEEMLSLVLSMRQRKLSSEEIELLKEIKSELEIIL